MLFYKNRNGIPVKVGKRSEIHALKLKEERKKGGQS